MRPPKAAWLAARKVSRDPDIRVHRPNAPARGRRNNTRVQEPRRGDQRPSVETLVGRLRDARCWPKPTGVDKWRSHCPAHEDTNPSLSITRGDDGRALVHCFKGCSYSDVARALRMTTSELFIRDEKKSGRRRKQTGPCTLQQAIDGVFPPVGQPDGHWVYHDEMGAELFAVARYLGPARKEIRPFFFVRGDDGAWKLGGPRGERPLYRLPEGRVSPEIIIVVKGEKCARSDQPDGTLRTTTSAFGGSRGG